MMTSLLRHLRQVAGLTDDLYAAYWTKGADVTDPAVLAALAGRHGLPADVYTQV
jgi:predicted DsbA family dithiol-disulfide isomerase